MKKYLKQILLALGFFCVLAQPALTQCIGHNQLVAPDPSQGQVPDSSPQVTLENLAKSALLKRPAISKGCQCASISNDQQCHCAKEGKVCQCPVSSSGSDNNNNNENNDNKSKLNLNLRLRSNNGRGNNNLLDTSGGSLPASPATTALEAAYTFPEGAWVNDASVPGGVFNHEGGKTTNPTSGTYIAPMMWPYHLPGYPTTGGTGAIRGIKEQMAIQHLNGGYTPTTSDTADMVSRAASATTAALAQPNQWLQAAKEAQNVQTQQNADTSGDMEKQQAACAIDFCRTALENFTVDPGNRWNVLRNQLFLPIAVLLLLPGAVAAQAKATVAQGFPIFGELSPIEGLYRTIVSIFLIPATYLIVNYGIDVSNSIAYTIQSEYKRIFNSDMYRDAMCAHIRAFATRLPSENLGFIPGEGAVMEGKGQGPRARYEGKNVDVKLEDPCAGLYEAPETKANEKVPYVVNTQRSSFNGMGAALAMTWNILCAFQLCYLYYLWFVGPIMAALWVWPIKQVREAFPNWCEGVVTICFWSLFWNTTILLMACCRGIDDTGTVIMEALNFLATACVKFAFDFAGLVKEAGKQAGKAAEQTAQGGGGKAGGKGRAGGKFAGAHSGVGQGLHAGTGHAASPDSLGTNTHASSSSAPSFDASSVGESSGGGSNSTASAPALLASDSSYNNFDSAASGRAHLSSPEIIGTPRLYGPFDPFPRHNGFEPVPVVSAPPVYGGYENNEYRQNTMSQSGNYVSSTDTAGTNANDLNKGQAVNDPSTLVPPVYALDAGAFSGSAGAIRQAPGCGDTGLAGENHEFANLARSGYIGNHRLLDPNQVPHLNSPLVTPDLSATDSDHHHQLSQGSLHPDHQQRHLSGMSMHQLHSQMMQAGLLGQGQLEPNSGLPPSPPQSQTNLPLAQEQTNILNAGLMSDQMRVQEGNIPDSTLGSPSSRDSFDLTSMDANFPNLAQVDAAQTAYLNSAVTDLTQNFSASLASSSDTINFSAASPQLSTTGIDLTQNYSASVPSSGDNHHQSSAAYTSIHAANALPYVSLQPDAASNNAQGNYAGEGAYMRNASTDANISALRIDLSNFDSAPALNASSIDNTGDQNSLEWSRLTAGSMELPEAASSLPGEAGTDCSVLPVASSQADLGGQAAADTIADDADNLYRQQQIYGTEDLDQQQSVYDGDNWYRQQSDYDAETISSLPNEAAAHFSPQQYNIESLHNYGCTPESGLHADLADQLGRSAAANDMPAAASTEPKTPLVFDEAKPNNNVAVQSPVQQTQQNKQKEQETARTTTRDPNPVYLDKGSKLPITGILPPSRSTPVIRKANIRKSYSLPQTRDTQIPGGHKSAPAPESRQRAEETLSDVVSRGSLLRRSHDHAEISEAEKELMRKLGKLD